MSYLAGTLPPMSEDEFVITHSCVVEIVVPARNAMDHYEPFSQLAHQIAEMVASLQPDLRVLHEALQQIAYSGIGEALQPILRQMAEMNSISGILARQRETMAAIAASFQPLPVPTAQELREAEAALRESLPETRMSQEARRKLPSDIAMAIACPCLPAFQCSRSSRTKGSPLRACHI